MSATRVRSITQQRIALVLVAAVGAFATYVIFVLAIPSATRPPTQAEPENGATTRTFLDIAGWGFQLPFLLFWISGWLVALGCGSWWIQRCHPWRATSIVMLSTWIATAAAVRVAWCYALPLPYVALVASSFFCAHTRWRWLVREPKL